MAEDRQLRKEIMIREAGVQDIEAILGLYDQPEMDDGHALDIERAKMVFDQVNAHPFYRFYVAVRDRDEVESLPADQPDVEVLGVYGLLIMPNFGHQGAPSAIVEGVCVHPACQGMGIGRQMILHAMFVAKQYACYKLALTSNIKRERAHAFYASLGFEQHGVSFQVAL